MVEICLGIQNVICAEIVYRVIVSNSHQTKNHLLIQNNIIIIILYFNIENVQNSFNI